MVVVFQSWVLQFIVVAVIVKLGLVLLAKKREAKWRENEMKSLLRLAYEESERYCLLATATADAEASRGYRSTAIACSFCGNFCSGSCQIKHQSNRHKHEYIETTMATDDRVIRLAGETSKLVNEFGKEIYSGTANDEADQPKNEDQASILGDMGNCDWIAFSREEFSSFLVSSSVVAEEGTTDSMPLSESSEEGTNALELHEERVRYLEEELTSSKNEILLLKSECDNWATRTSFVSRRLNRLMRDSDEHQIAEEAKVTESSKQDKHIRMLKSECARARRELQEEQEQVQRLKMKVEDISRNFMKKVEETRVAERRKQEKYIQMLEIAEEARDAERMEQEETIQILKSECVKLKRELEKERELVQRLQLEQDDAQIAKRKVEEIGQELAIVRENIEYASTRAALAENGRIKAMRELEEEQDLVQLLKLECEEIRQSAIRQVEMKEFELANALNAAAAAEAKLSDLEKEMNSLDDKACAICLTNENDMAFGCGHMICRDCGLTISTCPICREPITSRLRLFPG